MELLFLRMNLMAERIETYGGGRPWKAAEREEYDQLALEYAILADLARRLDIRELQRLLEL
jgi:hypothetical protein